MAGLVRSADELVRWVVPGLLLPLALAGPALAQSKVEFRTSPAGQHREFEVIVPPPMPGDAPSPDAKFFPPDHEVPYEPGFIEPLTFRPNKGPIERLGSAAWTSPPGRGYGGDQNFSGGWFSIGVGLTWK